MAIKIALGEAAKKVAISSIKGTIGHSLGAAGGLESIACIKTLQTGVIAPTINYEYPDPLCDLDYVPNTARQADPKVAVNFNLGFGGHNAALVFKKF